MLLNHGTDTLLFIPAHYCLSKHRSSIRITQVGVDNDLSSAVANAWFTGEEIGAVRNYITRPRSHRLE